MVRLHHSRTHGRLPAERSNVIKDDNVAPKKRTSNDGEKTMEPISDYNQNVIGPVASCFEEVHTIMSDLEKEIDSHSEGTNAFVTRTPIPEDRVPPEKDLSEVKCRAAGITYDDIMSFLEKLEKDTTDEMTRIMPEITESIEGGAGKNHYPIYAKCNSKIRGHEGYGFKEDLAMARLELEEKDATIALLKEQVRSERKSACESLDSQRKSHASKLQAQEEKYKTIVTRHQKFIEQLISEKTELTEKCDSLARHAKEMEAKFQRESKAATERHAVELRKVKEHCAASEKIRRERWVETRTSKIKEMTVKGLEPELRSMVEQHEEEIQRLRNAHVQELQDTELRIVRQSNQQLEQLRLELTASHEKILANEKNILWTRYKENLEERETQFYQERKKLLDDVSRQKTILLEEQTRLDSERDATIKREEARFQQEAENLKQQQALEKRKLEKSLKMEWETWVADYKRNQSLKAEKAEQAIRDECNKERDRQIELAIERLEENSRQMELTLRQNYENKLRSNTEKYDMEMQSLIESEKLQKERCHGLKMKLDDAETRIQETEKKLQEYVGRSKTSDQAIARLTKERDAAKKTARQEIEREKRGLENKIASLYKEINQINMDRETTMAQLHSRVKLIMTQKMLVIRNLNQELNAMKVKCEHLEKLLDQQRKEYILKSL